MRRLLIVLLVLAGFKPVLSQTTEQLVDLCVDRLEDATYLADFQVDLAASQPGQADQVARYSMVLNKNTMYRLAICNSDASPGRGIIQIFDSKGLVGSNYVESSDTYYPFFDIQINSTGVYHIFISFGDGMPGQAVGILSFVRRL